MPIAEALRGITQQIGAHQSRMNALAGKRMDIDYQNRQLDRQERIDTQNREMNELEKVKAIALNEEMARLKSERDAKENAPFSMRIGRTNSIPEARFQADRIMDGNKALSSALGYGVHFDPDSGNVLRDDTGQSLPNKAVMPHMKAIQAVTVLNSSPRRMIEDKIEAGGLPENKIIAYQAELERYKKDPRGMLEIELQNKEKQFAQLAPYLEKNPELKKQAERGIAQTQRDLDSLIAGQTKIATEKRAEEREVAKEKRSLLAETAKEERLRKANKEDFLSEKGYESALKSLEKAETMKLTGNQRDEDGNIIPIDEKGLKALDVKIKGLKEKIRTFEGGKKVEPKPEPFDPEGIGYDDEAAQVLGLKRDKTGHMQSRVELPKEATDKMGLPEGSGVILKGRKHPTWNETVKGEKEAGFDIARGPDGRYYSIPKKGIKPKEKAEGLRRNKKEEPKQKPYTATAAYNVEGYDKDGTLWARNPKTGQYGTYINNEFIPGTVPSRLFKKNPKE